MKTNLRKILFRVSIAIIHPWLAADAMIDVGRGLIGRGHNRTQSVTDYRRVDRRPQLYRPTAHA